MCKLIDQTKNHSIYVVLRTENPLYLLYEKYGYRARKRRIKHSKMLTVEKLEILRPILAIFLQVS